MRRENQEKSLPFQSAKTFSDLFSNKSIYIKSQEHASISNFHEDLLNTFKDHSKPSKQWVAEVVSMAITEDRDCYQRVLKSYLIFLNGAGVFGLSESYYLQGLADLLQLSIGRNSWITPENTHAIFKVIKGLSFLFDQNESLLLSEIHHRLQLWLPLCHALESNNVVIEQSLKKEMQKLFSSYKSIFEKADDFLGLYFITLASQALTRTENDGKSASVKIGYCLQSGVMNLLNAALGVGVATATFGVSSLAAIQPLVSAISDLTRAGIVGYKAIKEEYKKKEWYQGVHLLQGLCWVHAIDAIEKNEVKKFKLFIEDLKTLNMDADIDVKAIIVTKYALVDTLTQIFLVYPQKKESEFHDAIFQLLKYFFNNTKDLVLKGRLIDAFMMLGNMTGSVSFFAVIADFSCSDEEQFINLPITVSSADNFVNFYCQCEAISNKLEDAKELRKLMISRLEKQFPKAPETVAEILYLLERKLDQKLLKFELLDAYQKNEKMIKKIQQEIEILEKTRELPPLVLYVWNKLDDDHQKKLVKICKKHHVSELPIIPIKSSDFLWNQKLVLILFSNEGLNIIPPEKMDDKEAKVFENVSVNISERLGYTQRPKGEQREKEKNRLREATLTYIGVENLSGGLIIGNPVTDKIIQEIGGKADKWKQEGDKKEKKMRREHNSVENKDKKPLKKETVHDSTLDPTIFKTRSQKKEKKDRSDQIESKTKKSNQESKEIITKQDSSPRIFSDRSRKSEEPKEKKKAESMASSTPTSS